MYTYKVNQNQKQNINNYSNFFVTLRGVFLALILFCASFLAPYVGCNYQNILNEHRYFRHLLLFLVIYFSINLVDPNIETFENPIYPIIKSIFVYLIFLFLNMIDISVITIVLILFTGLIITSQYYNYFKKISPNPDRSSINIFNIIQIILSLSIIILLILSTIFNYKNKNFKNNFFNLNKCTKFKVRGQINN